jgi:dihydroorotate dehydrogenase
MQAGASVVQLYTGIIYRGPALVGECRRAILDWRRQAVDPGRDQRLANLGG